MFMQTKDVCKTMQNFKLFSYKPRIRRKKIQGNYSTVLELLSMLSSIPIRVKIRSVTLRDAKRAGT